VPRLLAAAISTTLCALAMVIDSLVQRLHYHHYRSFTYFDAEGRRIKTNVQ